MAVCDAGPSCFDGPVASLPRRRPEPHAQTAAPDRAPGRRRGHGVCRRARARVRDPEPVRRGRLAARLAAGRRRARRDAPRPRARAQGDPGAGLPDRRGPRPHLRVDDPVGARLRRRRSRHPRPLRLGAHGALRRPDRFQPPQPRVRAHRRGDRRRARHGGPPLPRRLDRRRRGAGARLPRVGGGDGGGDPRDHSRDRHRVPAGPGLLAAVGGGSRGGRDLRRARTGGHGLRLRPGARPDGDRGPAVRLLPVRRVGGAPVRTDRDDDLDGRRHGGRDRADDERPDEPPARRRHGATRGPLCRGVLLGRGGGGPDPCLLGRRPPCRRDRGPCERCPVPRRRGARHRLDHVEVGRTGMAVRLSRLRGDHRLRRRRVPRRPLAHLEDRAPRRPRRDPGPLRVGPPRGRAAEHPDLPDRAARRRDPLGGPRVPAGPRRGRHAGGSPRHEQGHHRREAARRRAAGERVAAAAGDGRRPREPRLPRRGPAIPVGQPLLRRVRRPRPRRPCRHGGPGGARRACLDHHRPKVRPGPCRGRARRGVPVPARRRGASVGPRLVHAGGPRRGRLRHRRHGHRPDRPEADGGRPRRARGALPPPDGDDAGRDLGDGRGDLPLHVREPLGGAAPRLHRRGGDGGPASTDR